MDSEKSIEGNSQYGLLSECFFIGRATYESYKNVATKYIFAVNKVPFDQVPISYCV